VTAEAKEWFALMQAFVESLPVTAAARTLKPVPFTEAQKAGLSEMVDKLGESQVGWEQYDEHLKFELVSRTSEMAIGSLSPSPLGDVSFQDPRVLRLLSMALQDRKLIASSMEKLLQESMQKWPEAFKQEYALWENSPRGISRRAPTPHDLVRGRAAVATYVLGEMEYYEELPAMWECYRQQQAWADAIPEKEAKYISQSPVAPRTSLYAMHRMISAYPEAGLGENALAAHRAYIKWAGDHVLAPDTYKVVEGAPAANPAFPAYRVQVWHEYPVTFRDGTAVEKYPSAPYVTAQTKEWLSLMQAFVVSLPATAATRPGGSGTAPATQAAALPDVGELARCVDQLNDDNYATREEATRRLSALPVTALPTVRLALAAKPLLPEAEARGAAILQKLEADAIMASLQNQAQARHIPLRLGGDPASIPLDDTVVMQIIPVPNLDPKVLANDLAPRLGANGSVTAGPVLGGVNTVVVIDTSAAGVEAVRRRRSREPLGGR